MLMITGCPFEMNLYEMNPIDMNPCEITPYRDKPL
jgi:hypothetical protein